jgi:hypothetical protein
VDLASNSFQDNNGANTLKSLPINCVGLVAKNESAKSAAHHCLPSLYLQKSTQSKKKKSGITKRDDRDAQGCQIFLGTKYQKGKAYTKLP